MAFSAEAFDQHLAVLTDPSLGVVEPTTAPHMFAVTRNQPDVGNARPLVVLTGPSRAGKDTIKAALLASNPHLADVRTATTRGRRPTETHDAMTWMRQRAEGESPDDYYEALVAEYDLVEHAPHNNEIYGLPRRNLTAVPETHVPLLNTDTAGIRSLAQTLAGEFALISVMICPESAAQIQERMGAIDNHSAARLDAAQGYLAEAPHTVNFAFRNCASDDPNQAAQYASTQIRSVLGGLGYMGAFAEG